MGSYKTCCKIVDEHRLETYTTVKEEIFDPDHSRLPHCFISGPCLHSVLHLVQCVLGFVGGASLCVSFSLCCGPASHKSVWSPFSSCPLSFTTFWFKQIAWVHYPAVWRSPFIYLNPIYYYFHHSPPSSNMWDMMNNSSAVTSSTAFMILQMLVIISSPLLIFKAFLVFLTLKFFSF